MKLFSPIQELLWMAAIPLILTSCAKSPDVAANMGSLCDAGQVAVPTEISFKCIPNNYLVKPTRTEGQSSQRGRGHYRGGRL